MELYLRNVTCKDAYLLSRAVQLTQQAPQVPAVQCCRHCSLSSPSSQQGRLQGRLWQGLTICWATQHSPVSPSASLSGAQRQPQHPELRLPTRSVPTPAGDKHHQKCWVDVIHTRWFLRRSFRTALIIIRRFAVVYYKFFNLHKSLNDGDDPEVHFSILKVTKDNYAPVWSNVTYNYFCHFSCL